MLYDSTVFNDLLAALIHLVIHGLFFGRSDPESEVLCDESPDRRKLYSVLVDEMLLLFNVAVGLPEEALFSVFKDSIYFKYQRISTNRYLLYSTVMKSERYISNSVSF